MKENGKWMKNWRSFHYYTENILCVNFILLNWKYVHNVFTILLPDFQSLFKHSQPHGACTILTVVWEEYLSVALWKPLSRRSKRWSSLTFWYTSVIKFEAANVIRRLLLAVSNVNNPVGLVCLPYVMWSAPFFVTHIQTENISSWNGPNVHVCCFM